MRFAESVRTHGAPKITFDSGERDYKQKLRSAQRQTSNPFEFGVQEVFEEGAGEAVKGSRTKYGNVNIMPQRLIEGERKSNFEQRDSPGNRPLDDPINQTGDVALGTSATRSANQDPEDFETSALDRRLAMYARAGSNAGYSNNDRSRSGRLG